MVLTLRDVTEEVKELALDNADTYDLITVNAIIFWFEGQLDSVHETGVYAASISYSIGEDKNGAKCPMVSFGFNTKKHLESTNADKYDTTMFFEKAQDSTDIDGAIDIWLSFKGYDMEKSTEQIALLIASAVKKMHDKGKIDEIFFRDIPVIIYTDLPKDKLDEINTIANGNLE